MANSRFSKGPCPKGEIRCVGQKWIRQPDTKLCLPDRWIATSIQHIHTGKKNKKLSVLCTVVQTYNASTWEPGAGTLPAQVQPGLQSKNSWFSSLSLLSSGIHKFLIDGKILLRTYSQFLSNFIQNDYLFPISYDLVWKESTASNLKYLQIHRQLFLRQTSKQLLHTSSC